MADYNRTEEAQEVFKQKKRPKNPIKYKIKLSEEQKEATQVIHDNDVTILYGKAGTSKTTVASLYAIDALAKGDVERVTLIRPTVATENIGFLPGSADDKLKPWFTPVIENLYDIADRASVDKNLEEGRIRLFALQFAQGVNFKREIIIFEEAENATDDQISMAMTRLCEGAKLIFTGDVAQIQLKNKKDSGFSKLLSLCSQLDRMGCYELKENRRIKIVQDFIELWQK